MIWEPGGLAFFASLADLVMTGRAPTAWPCLVEDPATIEQPARIEAEQRLEPPAAAAGVDALLAAFPDPEEGPC